MNILGIETSCDETAAAIIKDGRQILSNVVVSQIDIFKAYGGVIPEVAARSHLEAIQPVIDQAFEQAGFLKDDQPDWDKIDAIAVTHTPGLLGSLLIGTLTARTLAILHNKPLYATHHLKSHIYAAWLRPEKSGENGTFAGHTERGSASLSANTPVATEVLDAARESTVSPDFPVLALVVSGGHTQIIYMPEHNNFEIIGTTRDDAVGECFDKVAKILGLPYPGGPAISKAAEHGDPKKYPLPHPKIADLDFSFSGLKTAVLRAVQKELKKPISFPSHQLAPLLTDQQIADFAASFEQTAVDILLEKLSQATKTHPAKSIIIAGGVSANQRLRKGAEVKFPNCFFPEPRFSGDNAAMVAAAAFYEIQSGAKPTDPYSLNISPRSGIA